ncbi:hypothetical protein HB904_03960 [Listeria booriae]|uniref:Uncharacterized protein n=1 Tax=Listeria booriae TaxID=1552123 RepID=A0A842ADD3_9LIST|nr:hypothetical protein [Listeria booriae]MBC1615327.1 hypothetical protein [Listeria booriae]
MTGEDECEECPVCNEDLNWDLYCNNCRKQFASKDIDEYYQKLCVEAEIEFGVGGQEKMETLYAIVDENNKIAKHCSKGNLAVFSDLNSLIGSCWEYHKPDKTYSIAELGVTKTIHD